MAILHAPLPWCWFGGVAFPCEGKATPLEIAPIVREGSRDVGPIKFAPREWEGLLRLNVRTSAELCSVLQRALEALWRRMLAIMKKPWLPTGPGLLLGDPSEVSCNHNLAAKAGF